MKRATVSMRSALCVLSFVAAARVDGQQQMRALIRAATDRVAAPAFSLANASGNVVRLSDFRGRPVVLNFWATTCGGCRVELPTFVQVSQKYKGVTVVGVSMDIMYEDLKSSTEGWARVSPFVASQGMRYPILLDDGSMEKSFEVTALPATYLIDKHGRVAATYIGVVDGGDLPRSKGFWSSADACRPRRPDAARCEREPASLKPDRGAAREERH